MCLATYFGYIFEPFNNPINDDIFVAVGKIIVVIFIQLSLIVLCMIVTKHKTNKKNLFWH